MKAFLRTSLLVAAAWLGVSTVPAQASSTNLYNRQFAQADLDHDGFLSMIEFMGLQARNASWVNAAHRFNVNDVNHDSYLDPLEFRGSRGGRDGGKPSKLETFILADLDEDDFLDPAEYALTLPQSAPLSRAFRQFSAKDRNDDTLLSPREYGLRVF